MEGRLFLCRCVCASDGSNLSQRHIRLVFVAAVRLLSFLLAASDSSDAGFQVIAAQLTHSPDYPSPTLTLGLRMKRSGTLSTLSEELTALPVRCGL